MRYSLLLLFLLPFSAEAQVVLACDDAWGASDKCGGCSGLFWRTPTPNTKVKTNASEFWVKISTLKPNDKVFTHATKKNGDAATCTEGVSTKVSALTIAAAVAQSAPSSSSSAASAPPPTPPTPAPPPQAKPTAFGSAVISWTAPPLDTDKRPSKITGYHLRWNGGEATVGNVLTYTMKAPVGAYSLTVATMNGKEESAPSKPVTFVIGESK